MRKKFSGEGTVSLISPDPKVGLTEEEVEERHLHGKDNRDAEARAKSYRAIFRDNFFTPFNLLNAVLGAFVILTGAIQNALFLGVAFANTAVGIFQEIRAKLSVEKLSLITKAKVRVVREGREQEVPVEDIVLHDIILLSSGNQIPADCEVLSGFCEVDESLLTGESDAVFKEEGAALLSGSYVVAGNCKVMVQKVGRDSYAYSITNASKKIKKVNSEIINSFNTIIKFLSVLIVFLGIILFVKQYFLQKETLQYAISSTVAAIIGMVPEGMVLLTNIVMAVGVIRLASQRVLVQEMYCIETLARVDMLCIDKTGTITEGKMQVSDVYLLDDGLDFCQVAGELIAATGDTNSTATAIDAYCNHDCSWEPVSIMPFSPSRKWSGASFAAHGSYILGSPEVLMQAGHIGDEALQKQVKHYYENGARTLLLAYSSTILEASNDVHLPEDLQPVALVAMEDTVRKEAAEIFEFLNQEGVATKIISGDSGRVAHAVALKAGIKNSRGYIDTYQLSDEEVKAAALKYSVFGRVTPHQKRLIVEALKENDHVVAMLGDGVNDVLALKESDCSIAVSSGSDVTRAISQIVLLNSDLHAIYNVIMEGRRVINNIKKSASLYLVKTIYSSLLAILFVFLPFPYPFQPIQLSLISSVCVGIPSFFLAIEPNKNRVEGKFLGSVVKNAFPGAICIVIYVIVLTVVLGIVGYTQEQISTLCTIATGICTFFVLMKLSLPFNWLRGAVTIIMTSVFLVGILYFQELLFLAPLNKSMLVIIGAIGASVYFLNKIFTNWAEKMKDRFDF